MTAVSVIIPVYNAEMYLEKCLDSLVNQTYCYFEAVLVNDGSTDGSQKICERYALQDSRINVICKGKNEGLICARMEGIRNARAKYIAFVDADDWIDKDFLEILVGNMEKNGADIVVSGCIKENEKDSVWVKNNISNGIYEGMQLLKIYPKMLHYEGFYNFGILPYVCNKLYKRDLLLTCYSDIDTYINDGEDVAMVFPYLLKANKVVVSDAAKYHYRIHSQSMTAHKKKDFYENVSRLYLHLKREFSKTKYLDIMLPQLDQYMRMMVWHGNPESFIEAERHIFPFGKVHKGEKIVLYGAGRVGKIYHHQIDMSKYCEIAAWVDKNLAAVDPMIKGTDAIFTEIFDCIVIAIADKRIQNEVREELLKCGINSEKIII